MADSSEPASFAVPIPEHLIPTIVEAIEGELERACDDAWSDGSRTSVLKAARLWDSFMAKTLTPSLIAEVASRLSRSGPRRSRRLIAPRGCSPRHAS
jgi:hypothetical protein